MSLLPLPPPPPPPAPGFTSGAPLPRGNYEMRRMCELRPPRGLPRACPGSRNSVGKWSRPSTLCAATCPPPPRPGAAAPGRNYGMSRRNKLAGTRGRPRCGSRCEMPPGSRKTGGGFFRPPRLVSRRVFVSRPTPGAASTRKTLYYSPLRWRTDLNREVRGGARLKSAIPFC